MVVFTFYFFKRENIYFLTFLMSIIKLLFNIKNKLNVLQELLEII